MKTITAFLLAAVNPQTTRGILPLILPLLLASGCVSSVTKSAVMGDPQISAIQGQMSKEEAVAVLRHQMENTVKHRSFDIPAFFQEGAVIDSFSVDSSGFVFKGHKMVDPRPAPPAGFHYTYNYAIPIPVGDTTIAFADIKWIKKTGRFYMLFKDRGSLLHDQLGAFDSSSTNSSDMKKFLAALFLLCPNAR
jgi:hypothetical protein